MKKPFLIILSLCLIFFIFSFSASALTINVTYSDVVSSSTQANNLLNFAMSYESFRDSDFVIFCDQQYSYYLVWGDLTVSDAGVVSGADVEYIRYYREGDSYSSSYVYNYGTDVSFGLNPSDMVTSNLPDYGFSSELYRTYISQFELKHFLILLSSFCFVLMILRLRGSSK